VDMKTMILKSGSLSVLWGLVLLFNLGQAGAEEAKTEEQCARQIKGTLDALEMQSANTGQEQKLKGLTISQINKMRETKGECYTAQEIARITNN